MIFGKGTGYKICPNVEMEEKMRKVPDDIGKMKIGPLTQSLYLKPYRAEFRMNGKTRYWDFLKVHDSVAILLYNITRQVFVVVRQFRPAMYLAQMQEVTEGSEINPENQDLVKGYSLELCAGLLDKTCPIEQTAKEEVLEECGYDIPITSLLKLFSFRNVGISGQQNTVFYAEVTDEQKVSEGGGIKEEGESIEVIEMTIPEMKRYISSCDIQSPPSFMAAIQWFLAKMKDSENVASLTAQVIH